jgi:hypothetical protein
MKENKNDFYPMGVFIGLFLLFFFTFIFFVDNRISGLIYWALVSTAILCGLIVCFKNSIKEFNLKEMRVVLEHTQTVKQKIDETAISMVEIMAYQSVYSSGSWLNRKELNDKIEALLDSVNIDLSKKESILEMPRLMEKFMKDKESLTEAEKKKVDEVFKLKE